MYTVNSVWVVFLFLTAFVCWINAKRSEALGTFGFDIHHRYSDRVKDFLAVDGLPEQGTFDYFAAMARRDHLFKARRLADATPSSPTLTFIEGNDTYRLNGLGFLHYAIVTVGTPGVPFLAALDTGSDLFWIPCDCTSCLRSLNSSSGGGLDLNIYYPNASSTSMPVPCSSPLCGPRRGCSIRRNACTYQSRYLSSNTSSTGTLIDDVLRLTSDDSQQKPIDAPITLGCGIIQTGAFLEGGAPNGLFGLGLDNISVPSILASKGLAANSFGMCFGPDGRGRIDFGYKGGADLKVTPINVEQLHPTYNVTVTQMAVGNTSTDSEFTAIFDSGTSFTYLNDPAYSLITENFDSQVTETRYEPDTKIMFDYCYKLGASQTHIGVPDINLTMKGGNNLFVKDPIIVIKHDDGVMYCLAMIKSEDVNIIGQNFMTGYRIIFDREEMVLGWEESDCYDSIKNTLPINKNSSTTAPSPSIIQPEDIPRNTSKISPASEPRSTVPIPPPPAPPAQGNNAIRMRSINKIPLIAIFFLSFQHHHLLMRS